MSAKAAVKGEVITATVAESDANGQVYAFNRTIQLTMGGQEYRGVRVIYCESFSKQGRIPLDEKDFAGLLPCGEVDLIPMRVYFRATRNEIEGFVRRLLSEQGYILAPIHKPLN